MYKTNVIMNSGKDYWFHFSIDELMKIISDEDKKPFNKFINIEGVRLNPSHISSIESHKTEEITSYDESDPLVLY